MRGQIVSFIGLCALVVSMYANANASLDSQLKNLSQGRVLVMGAPPAAAVPFKATFQQGLASVVVGTSTHGVPVGYRLILVPVVPSNIDSALETRIRVEVPPVLDRLARELRDYVDALPGMEESAALNVQSNEDMKTHFSRYASNTYNHTRERLQATAKEFEQRVSGKFPGVALAIGLRPCAEPTCSLREFAARAYNRSTDRFGKIYGALHSDGPLQNVNQFLLLSPKAWLRPVPARLDTGFEWHQDFPTALLQQTLTEAAKRARRYKTTLSYSAAMIAGLSREQTAHIADVFDSSYAAGVGLPSNPGAKLSGISDELGRARISECVRLRGAYDPSDAGNCAGFALSQSEIATCISGGECMPAFGQQVNLDSLTVRANETMSYLAQNAALPRARLGNLEDLKTFVNQCTHSGGDAQYCLLKVSVGRNPNTLKTLECVRDVQTRGSTSLAACATATLTKEQQAQVDCYRNHSNNYKDLAICATASSLPPTAQRSIACLSEMKAGGNNWEAAATCIGSGSREAGCVTSNRNDWQAAALCIAGNHLPPTVQSAVRCAEQSGSLTSFGVCMVADQGSGEAQRIAACYAETQGVPAAVAVCLASKNLTQDQRIVLECAAQTSGAVPATAVCVGGKMIMKELVNCRGKSFGEGSCFGDGNEIRKGLKAVGIEIGPHSVVADVVNVQLRIADATVTPVLDVAGTAVADLVKVSSQLHIMTIDAKHPERAIVGEQIAEDAIKEIGKGIGSYCDHNWCP